MFKSIISWMLLCALLLTAGCAGENAAAGTPLGELSPAPSSDVSEITEPTPKPAPTPEPLPDIGTLVARYDAASGMILTWAPFVTEFTCTLERRDSEDAEYGTVTTVDSDTGTYTDAQPGTGGTQPAYRLCVSDGARRAYSKEASADVPFIYGSTGGNLQNGGLVCEYGGMVYRLGIDEDVIGIYALGDAGSATLLVKGIAYQLNAAGGFLYYIKQATGELFRVQLDGGEPELIYDDEKMASMLVAGGRIYGTLEGNHALVVMDTDGSGADILEARGCFDLGAYGQTLYYTDTETGQFCMRDLVSGEMQRMPMTGRCFAQLWDGRVYYQDEANGRRLISCLPDGSDAQVLLSQAVTGINVTERGVYCVNRSDGGTLYRVALDGSEAQQLAAVSGDYVNTVGEDLMLISADGRFYQIGEDGTVTKLYG